jgi:cell division initiation protein
MDVTPQILHDVEFRSKVRGYDPDEVDDFLERVAVAVGDLQARLREAIDRADAAEATAADAQRQARSRESSETDETLRRTLVLAQRTADAAIKEAEETASRTLQAAEEQAARLLADARDQSARVVADADAEARRTADDTRQRLVQEVIALEEVRDALRGDAGVLERHLEEQRLRLRSSLADLQRLLDDPAGLRAATMPPLSGASAPAASPSPEPRADEIAFEPEPDMAEEPAADIGEAPQPELEPQLVEAHDAGDAAGGDDATDMPFEAMVDVRDVAEDPLAVPDALFEPLPADADLQSRLGIFDGHPTEAVSVIDSDDAYLAELRKAMIDDPSARDEPIVFDQDEPGAVGRSRSRFGRRR